MSRTYYSWNLNYNPCDEILKNKNYNPCDEILKN